MDKMLLDKMRLALADGGSISAPVSSLGLYDPAHEAALNIQRKQGPGQAFLNEIQRGDNVRKSMLESTGLAGKLASAKTLTRDQVQQLVAQHTPKIEEHVLAENVIPTYAKQFTDIHHPDFDPADPDHRAEAMRLAEASYEMNLGRGNLDQAEFAAAALDDLQDLERRYKSGSSEAKALAKYGDYTIPGGENYREVLLTLPTKRESLRSRLFAMQSRLADLQAPRRMGVESEAEYDARIAQSKKLQEEIAPLAVQHRAEYNAGSGKEYRSSHWDQPNVLAHVRMNDRTDAEGKKVLFIEELQSDWGQEGRKKGFANPGAVDAYEEYIKDLKSRASELIMKNFTDEGVPPDRASQLTNKMIGRMEDWNFAKLLGETSKLDELFKAKRAAGEAPASAPFVTDTNEWVDLGLKNILKRAVKEGYDRVAFINGKQSADRYNLTNYVDKLEFVRTSGGVAPGPDDLGHGLLIGYDKSGHRIIERAIDNPEKQLPDYIGKEAAQRMLEQQPKQGRFGGMGASVRTLQGQGLEVGGTSMKKFYDEIVPNRIRKILGKNASLREVQFEDRAEKLREQLANATPGSSRYLYLTDKIGEIERDAERYGAVGTQLGFDITPEIRERFGKPVAMNKGGGIRITDDIVALPVTQMAEGGEVPKKSVTAYKLFRVDRKQPGKLFPLFVNANKPVERNKWVDAEIGPQTDKGKVQSKLGPLAFRPGWHAGDLPIATHIGEKDDEQKAEIRRIKALRAEAAGKLGGDKKAKAQAKKKHPFPDWVNAPRLRNANHVWAEVEMPDDVDWQTEAERRGTKPSGKFVAKEAHITDRLPEGGHYRYKTNPNMTGNWLIGGAMKVNRVLPDQEVEDINKRAGTADLPRKNPIDVKKLGFAHGGTLDQMRYALLKRKG